MNTLPLHEQHQALGAIFQQDGDWEIPTHYGKDHQLQINSGDFPTLAKTGLHSEAELNIKDMIL